MRTIFMLSVLFVVGMCESGSGDDPTFPFDPYPINVSPPAYAPLESGEQVNESIFDETVAGGVDHVARVPSSVAYWHTHTIMQGWGQTADILVKVTPEGQVSVFSANVSPDINIVSHSKNIIVTPSPHGTPLVPTHVDEVVNFTVVNIVDGTVTVNGTYTQGGVSYGFVETFDVVSTFAKFSDQYKGVNHNYSD